MDDDVELKPTTLKKPVKILQKNYDDLIEDEMDIKELRVVAVLAVIIEEEYSKLIFVWGVPEKLRAPIT